ncbi:MAG: oligoribonuclease [Patescibacteria group bacterium]
MSTNIQAPLVWIDCEFTSLDFHHNKMVEIACVITDAELNILGEPVSCIIGYTPEELDPLLSEWSREHFEESLLLEKIYQSTTTLQEAEECILNYLGQFTQSGESPLCGNSVSQDRRVLYTNMPKLDTFLHYRIIDVSTLKELVNRWRPEIAEYVNKKQAHRALDDIYESIEELRVYKNHLFK